MPGQDLRPRPHRRAAAEQAVKRLIAAGAALAAAGAVAACGATVSSSPPAPAAATTESSMATSLATPAAKGCGPVKVTSLSFGITASDLLAGGTCGTSGATAVFSYSSGSGWRRLSLPVSGQLVRLNGGRALVRGESGLSALWDGTGWYAYAPQQGPASWTKSAPLRVPGPISASGGLAYGGAWVLFAGGRAATVSLTSGTAASSPGATPHWVQLPAAPARTAVLASGLGGAVDALAVSGKTLTVWRLARGQGAWAKVQTINVPLQVGSSG